jgi:cellulose biosynthesis protein BcsQ
MKVLLVDLDENGSAGGSLRWAAMAQMAGRSPAFTVSPAMPRHVMDWDLVVVDHPPGVRKLPDGLVIVPTTCDPGTYFSALRTLKGLKGHKTKPILVANRCRTDRAEVRRLIAEIPGTLVLKDRAIYPSSFGQGVTLWDDVGLLHADAARGEFTPLLDAVLATRCRMVHLVNTKGGVGRSTIALNLAGGAALRQLNQEAA